MSDTEEERRAKQLEEARKRVEELKKKKKSKKSKSKNKNKNAEPANETEGGSKEPTVDVEGSEDVQVMESDIVEAEEGGEDGNVAGEDKEVGAGEVVQGSSEEIAPETKGEEDEQAQGETEISEFEKDQSEANAEQLEEKVALIQPDSNIGQPSLKEDKEVARAETVSEEPRELLATETKTTSQSPDDLFGSHDETSNIDFMTSIQHSKEHEEEVRKLKAQLDEFIIENKRLKFVNMEHETTVEELHEEIKKLNEQVAELQREKQSSPSIQFTRFNTQSVEATETHIDRVVLNKWRDWNVDMTTWRSIGSGPIVEF
ncbi:hypothetical protein KAFR_0K02430 [Kazachstania africana CBS 2517]|uniref:Uncharacterized protein n=1 Tax=Kazachstania africana (strain ATCC 22294 / BCRC 22015 / CBS 2517 / CECT 1963 / NBRC 1671 / NRRL Y-8276) TaxID=1071382 RepID=H2B1U9_KAZAF|nr:hypothetical protein KAFR_0K02430 [Kazachstania africana CBS 2517]CCF60599.1 hypothetical protein KAFR_0K02430 [Kazachstania africana CBS 2517]